MFPKVTILFFIFFSTIFHAWAFQSPSVEDSLVNLLNKIDTKQDTQRVNMLNVLAFELRNIDNQKALKYGEQALSLSEKINFKRGMMVANGNLGWIYYRMDNNEKSLNYAVKGLKMAEEFKDIAQQISNLNTIACDYSDRAKYDATITYLSKAILLSKKISDQYLLARTLNNIASSYLLKSKPDSALFYTKQALSAGEAAQNLHTIAFAFRNMGDVYFQKKQISKALAAYQEALKKSEQENNNYLTISLKNRTAKIYLEANLFSLAINELDKAIQIGKQYNFPYELHIAYQLMSEVYKQNKDFEKALDFQLRYMHLHDSLYDAETNKQTAMMENQFESEKKQSQIALLAKNNALQQITIAQKNSLLYWILGALMVLSLLIFLLARYNRQKKKAYKTLFEQRNAIAEQNEEIKQAKEELKSQSEHLKDLNNLKDKILAIISHDLRSPVASLSNLLALFNTSEISKEELTLLIKGLKKNIDVLSLNMDNLLQWAYTQMGGLQTNKEIVDIHYIIEGKMNFFEVNLLNKRIGLQNKVPENTFIHADKEQLRLIFRNLIANAIKFTPIKGQIIIDYEKENENYIIFNIKDTGVGMTKEKVASLFSIDKKISTQGTEGEKGTGLGLLLCKEFIEKNGGTIWVKSELYKGSTFSFKLPLSAIC